MEFNNRPMPIKVYLNVFNRINEIGNRIYILSHGILGDLYRKPASTIVENNTGDIGNVFDKGKVLSIRRFAPNFAPEYRREDVYKHLSFKCASLDITLDAYAVYVLLDTLSKSLINTPRTYELFVTFLKYSITYNTFKSQYMRMKTKFEVNGTIDIPKHDEILKEVEDNIKSICNSLEEFEHEGIKFSPKMIQDIYNYLKFNEQFIVKEIERFLALGGRLLLMSKSTPYSQIILIDRYLLNFPKYIKDSYRDAYKRLLDDLYIFHPPKVDEIINAIVFKLPKAGSPENYGLFLVWGPPGSGKTSMARILHHKIGGTLKELSLPDIMSKYVGESEKILRRTLNEGKGPAKAKVPYIILFDEAELLVTGRQMSGEAGAIAFESTVATFKSELSKITEEKLIDEDFRYNYFVFLTTNKYPYSGDVDPAFKRRFNFLLVDGLIPVREIFDAFAWVEFVGKILDYMGKSESELKALQGNPELISICDNARGFFNYIFGEQTTFNIDRYTISGAIREDEIWNNLISKRVESISEKVSEFPIVPTSSEIGAGLLLKSLILNVRNAVGIAQSEIMKVDTSGLDEEKRKKEIEKILAKYLIYSAYALATLWNRYILLDLKEKKGAKEEFTILPKNYNSLREIYQDISTIRAFYKLSFYTVKEVFIKEEYIYSRLKSGVYPPVLSGRAGFTAQIIKRAWRNMNVESIQDIENIAQNRCDEFVRNILSI